MQVQRMTLSQRSRPLYGEFSIHGFSYLHSQLVKKPKRKDAPYTPISLALFSRLCLMPCVLEPDKMVLAGGFVQNLYVNTST
jgi:hypothetical protein